MAKPIIEFYNGDTVYLDLKLTDGDTADDLSSAIIYVTMKAALTDSDGDAVLLHSQVIPASPDAEAGLATVIIPTTLTASVTAGVYFIDIRRVKPGSPDDVWTIQAGKAKVLQSVLQVIP